MKKNTLLISFLLLALITTVNSYSQCPNIAVYLESQEQIDNFASTYPGCFDFDVPITIEEDVPGNITNLLGLSQIIEVSILKIQNNQSLTSLEGLNNLTKVSNSYSSTSLQIFNNASLQNVEALQNLTHVGSGILINANPLLNSIEGFRNVTNQGLNIRVMYNPSLQSLNGFNNFTNLESIVLAHNAVLNDITSLETLTELTRTCVITFNDQLETLDGLNNLISVGYEGLVIEENISLIDLSGLESLQIIEQDLKIWNCPSLVSLNGINNLNYIEHDLNIAGLPLITNINELGNVTHIESLIIGSNDNLIDISGIENAVSDFLDEVTISNNPLLAICNYQNICTYLRLSSNYSYISNNSEGCDDRYQVLDACGPLSIADNTITTNFSIHPNPTDGSFTISGIKKGTVQITDSRGRVLKTFTLGKDETSLNGLAEGIYFMNISNEKGSVTKRLIKI